MRFRNLLPALLLLLLAAIPAYAQLEVDLSVNPLSGQPGDVVTFQATLVNLGSDPLYLNGVDLSGVPGGLTVDPTNLFVNFPPVLNPGDSYSGDLFDAGIDPTLTPGAYTGVFSILGSSDPVTQNDLVDVSFEVDVLQPNAMPEPGSLIGLAALVVAGLGFAARRAPMQLRCR